MTVNLNLDDDLQAIKDLSGTNTTWFAKVASVCRKGFHSAANIYGPAATQDTLASIASMPVGGIADWISTSIPDGYVECDGRSLSRTQYSELHAVIGTRYGSDSADTFKVPDFRRRQAVGREANGNVGVRTGQETVVMSTDNLPSHTHATTGLSVANSPLHAHQSDAVDFAQERVFSMEPDQNYTAGPGWPPLGLGFQQSGADAADHTSTFFNTVTHVKSRTSLASNDHTHSVTGSTADAGASENISVVSPSITMVKCIYAGQA